MVQFHIQTDSVFQHPPNYSIKSGLRSPRVNFPPGHRLPSTRQLAMQTGLHRNTISKVYRQLENTGLVEAQAGSGIYVRAQGNEHGNKLKSPILEEYPLANKIVQGVLIICWDRAVRSIKRGNYFWPMTGEVQRPRCCHSPHRRHRRG